MNDSGYKVMVLFSIHLGMLATWSGGDRYESIGRGTVGAS